MSLWPLEETLCGAKGWRAVFLCSTGTVVVAFTVVFVGLLLVLCCRCRCCFGLLLLLFALLSILIYWFHQGGKPKGKFTLYKSSLQEYRPDTHQFCFEVSTPSTAKTGAKTIVVRAYGEQEMHMVSERKGEEREGSV